MIKWKPILIIGLIGFALNLVWENAQAPLYQGYGNFWRHFPVCFWGTIGDVLIIILVYFRKVYPAPSCLASPDLYDGVFWEGAG